MLAVLVPLSFLGYIIACSNCHRNVFCAYAPAVVCSGIIVTIDLGGVLGILPMTATCLLYTGLVLLAFSVYRMIRHREELHAYSILLLLLYVGCCALFWRYIRANVNTIYHYDNFSHWGIIARFLTRCNRFPSVADTDIISFTSYPVGSACFIYYVCHILGDDATSTMLAVQALLIFSCYFAVLTGVQRLAADQRFRNRFALPRLERVLPDILYRGFHGIINAPWIETAAGILAAGFLTFYNTELNNLLVDNLLSAAGVSACVICFQHEQELRKHVWELGTILGATLAIKNSGLFLALFALILCLMILQDDRTRRTEERLEWQIRSGCADTAKREKLHAGYLLMIVLIPAVVFLAWKLHCSGFSASKHSMSLSAYASKLTSMSS